MSVNLRTVLPWPKPGEVFYPESDGKPMADNTEQFNWIVFLVENLKALFLGKPDVFVAGNLLWYPVQGRVDISLAPDVMVAFGRPMGDRGCYKQWEEGGIAPQVVFDVLSPSEAAPAGMDKLSAYGRFGVEECYMYDPREMGFLAWRRRASLESVEKVDGFQSPRLGVRFWRTGKGLKIEKPDGTVFETFGQVMERLRREHERAEQESRRAERLATKLRSLGINPNAL
jgi:Uma2 family endonuclease